MQEYIRYIRLLVLLTVGVLFLVGCKDSKATETNNPTIITPPSELNNTIKQDEFNSDDIEKVLPNGEKFTINTIKEITDTPTVASEKIYQTKIDESGDGFFVVNGDSIEGIFTKDGKSYSIGTFKDGQRIIEVTTLKDSNDTLLPPLNKNNSNLSKYSSPKYRLTDNTKANVSILFLYNNDFWNWCDNDNTIVKNKLDAMIAYTNTAFTRSAINATINIVGAERMVFDYENENTSIFLNDAIAKLSNTDEEIYKLREQYKADIVFIIKKVTYLSSGYTSGRGAFSIIDTNIEDDYVQESPNRAIGVQDITTGTHHGVFTHEIGHIFGCNHDKQTKIDDGSYTSNINTYANGYWFDIGNSKYTTMMGYTTGGRTKIQNFSNPNIDYEGVPTGIAGDSYDAADCARFINFSAPLIANFKTETVVTSNQSPIADAGDDISANEGESITLDGSGSSDSDGNIISYEWSEGNTILSNNSLFNTSDFSVGTHTLTLTITDDDGATASDDVVVTVKDVVIPNQAPIANAGTDITADEETIVSLDGSGSSDVEGDISYLWSQTSGTTVTLNNPTTDKPSFIAPSVDSDSVLEFKLVVTDSDGATSEDLVTVTVENIDNQRGTLILVGLRTPWGEILPMTNITLSTGIFSPGTSISSIGTHKLKNIGDNSLTIYGVEYQGSDEIIMYGVEECNNIVLDVNESTNYKCSPNFSYTPTLVGLHTGNVIFKYNDGMDKNITIPVTLNVIAEALKVNSLDEGFILNRPPNNNVAGSHFLDYYSYMFESNTSDISLHLTGYDVDVENEICVYLNDAQLQCLPTTLDNEYGQPLEIDIPYSMQKDGNNSIEIRQLKAGDLWGIRDIGIFKWSNKDKESPNIDSITSSGCQVDEANNRFILSFDYKISDNLSSLEELSFITYGFSSDFEEILVKTPFAECIKSNECTKIDDNTIRIQNIWGFEKGSDWERYYLPYITMFADKAGNEVKILFGTGDYSFSDEEVQKMNKLRLPKIEQNCTRTIPPNRTDLNFNVTPKGVSYTSDTTEVTIQFDITNNNYLGLVKYEYKNDNNTSSGNGSLRSVGGCPITYPGVNICGGFLDATLYSDTTSWTISNSMDIDINNSFDIRFCNQDSECTQWYSYDINLK